MLCMRLLCGLQGEMVSTGRRLVVLPSMGGVLERTRAADELRNHNTRTAWRSAGHSSHQQTACRGALVKLGTCSSLTWQRCFSRWGAGILSHAWALTAWSTLARRRLDVGPWADAGLVGGQILQPTSWMRHLMAGRSSDGLKCLDLDHSTRPEEVGEVRGGGAGEVTVTPEKLGRGRGCVGARFGGLRGALTGGGGARR